MDSREVVKWFAPRMTCWHDFNAENSQSYRRFVPNQWPTWMFPKIVGFPPKSSIFYRVFHEINHPFWETPLFLGFHPHVTNVEIWENLGHVSDRHLSRPVTSPVLHLSLAKPQWRCVPMCLVEMIGKGGWFFQGAWQFSTKPAWDSVEKHPALFGMVKGKY